MKTRKILLICKCPENAATLGFILGMGGFRVDRVRELDEAINWLTLRESYDLIVVDPEDLRLDLLQELEKARKAVPVLLTDRQRAKSEEVFRYFSQKSAFFSCLREDISPVARKILP